MSNLPEKTDDGFAQAALSANFPTFKVGVASPATVLTTAPGIRISPAADDAKTPVAATAKAKTKP